MSRTKWKGKEIGKSRKTNMSASWFCPTDVALRSSLCHEVCTWPQLPPCENLGFGTWPSGFVQLLRRELRSHIGVPMPLGSSCADFQLPLLLQSGPYPIDHATVMPPPQQHPSLLQNRNYFAHFLSKSKNRKEKGTANLVQLLVLLLNKVILQ